MGTRHSAHFSRLLYWIRCVVVLAVALGVCFLPGVGYGSSVSVDGQGLAERSDVPGASTAFDVAENGHPNGEAALGGSSEDILFSADATPSINDDGTSGDGFDPDAEGEEEGISATTSDGPGDSSSSGLESQETGSLGSQERLFYAAGVSGLGWQDHVTAGEIAGTTGKSLPVVAFQVGLSDQDADAVTVRGHIQNVGWTGWRQGQIGDASSALALEAIELRLDAAVADGYHLWYRVHVSNIGWMGWACDGAPAGTSGQGLPIEAIELILLDADAPAPGATDDAYRGASEGLAASATFINGSKVNVDAFPSVVLGDPAGFLPMQSYALSLTNQVVDGSISYQSLVYGEGWQTGWAVDGAEASSTSGSPVEAIRIRIDGNLSNVYDVWYRVYRIGEGWSGWAASGEPAGSEGLAKGISAIEVLLQDSGLPAPGSQENSFQVNDEPLITYQAHSANYGWQSVVKDGSTAGVTGESCQLEALRVVLEGASDSSLQVSAHVAEVGWQDWTASGAFAGTTGKGLAMQAVRIRLEGRLSATYDVIYRVHSADYGWLGWARNGETAGTVGLNKRAEAVEIRLVAKGEDAPGSSLPPSIEIPVLSYAASVMGAGWQQPVTSGGLCGTTGQSRGIDAFTLELASSMSGGVSYAAHVQDCGWMQGAADGSVAGLPGSGLRVEAIRLELTGDIASYFDIWYRAYVENYGWLGWAKNGADAGTSTIGYRLEAFEVRLTLKGAAAPGSTSSAFVHVPYSPNVALLNVPCLLQNPELPTGCESVALTNVLNYYGFGLAKTTMADSYIPRSSWDFVTSFWGDPHSSRGNCCSAPAITASANAFLTLNHSSLRAYDITDASLETMYGYIAAGNPVIVWSTMYQGNVGRAYAWQQYNGRTYFTVTNSHTIVLRGFDRTSNTVYIADSLSGYVTMNAGRFYQLYVGRGSQAVVIH